MRHPHGNHFVGSHHQHLPKLAPLPVTRSMIRHPQRYTAISCGLFSSFPDEVLMQILSTLSPVEHTFLAGTCVRMNRLIDDQFLWKEVTLKAFRSIIDDASIQILSRTRFRGVHSGVFRLQHLDISLCSNLTDVALNDLCKIASGLLRLNVAGCSKVSDQGISVLSQCCYKLKVLNLHWLEDVTDKGIGQLALHCPELEELDLTWTKVSEAGLMMLATSCPNLSRLTLSCLPALSDEGMSAVVEHLPRLRKLDVSLNDKVGDGTLRALLEYCPLLEEVNVASCNVTLPTLHHFLRNSKTGMRVISLL